MRKLIAIVLLLSVALSLSACGNLASIYNSDYYVIEDYPLEPSNSSENDSLTVTRFAALKNGILKLIMSGSESGTIRLDANYNGDPAEDLARACWELRSQNAICAYCVDNIAYELTQIVTYYEANVNISYAQRSIAVSDVHRLNFAYELKELLKEAMEAGEQHLAVFVNSSFYSAEDISKLVNDIYYAAPTMALAFKGADVNVYSGSSGQKLYELAIDYGGEEDTLAIARERLLSLEPFKDMDIDNMPQVERAFAACLYLMQNCQVTSDSKSSCFDALLDKLADSKGIALGFVELCNELGLNCQLVQGQYNWVEHYWNIVEIDGANYHIDVTACIFAGLEAGFLFNDNSMWGSYRWDIASYPECSGDLTAEEFIPFEPTPEIEPEPYIENVMDA